MMKSWLGFGSLAHSESKWLNGSLCVCVWGGGGGGGWRHEVHHLFSVKTIIVINMDSLCR